ncbi:MAG TPA: hypothetical protein VF666_00025 [Pyrinomonadaceae bacterium]
MRCEEAQLVPRTRYGYEADKKSSADGCLKVHRGKADEEWRGDEPKVPVKSTSSTIARKQRGLYTGRNRSVNRKCGQRALHVRQQNRGVKAQAASGAARGICFVRTVASA